MNTPWIRVEGKQIVSSKVNISTIAIQVKVMIGVEVKLIVVSSMYLSQ